MQQVKDSKKKKNKYTQVCENEGIKFFPVIVETFGGWHKESELVISKLARQLASQTGVPCQDTIQHWNNSVVLQKFVDFRNY